MKGALLFLLWVAPAAFGQATGTIHGTIYDATGAVVPVAKVTVTHAATNQSRTVFADEAGRWVAPLLPVGVYQIRVEKEGFAPFVQTDVHLQVNTNIQVNAHLEVAGTAEQVTVSADATLVQATSTHLVQVVDERRIVDLPLNGRNVLQLVTLGAGISDRGAAGWTLQINSFGGAAYHVPVSINGSRGDGTNFLLDNADNNDGYTNIAEPYPNPDAIQEFSIQTSTFDAQYGRGVGGAVNVVTRSGTNEVHGTVFEFLRNHQLNAANFFAGRDAMKRNQFGFTIGGPVYLPRLYRGKDRTFIFGSYQGTRTRIATPGALRVAPSEAMKQGDLSEWLRPDGTGRIRDPLGPGYFPGNLIPKSRFDPVSNRLLAYMPSSADPTYALRFGTPSQVIDDDQMLIRGDHTISSSQRLTLRYFLLHYDRPWKFIPNNLYYVLSGQYGNAHHATVNHSYTLTPRLLNELTLAFHRTTPTAMPPRDLDLSFEKLGARIRTVPGFPTMDVSISNWSGIGLALGYSSPQTTYQVANTVSYATGRHNLRFGADAKRYVLDIASYWLSGGSASFTGQLLSDPGKVNAGNAFAEFLLGHVSTWRQQSFSSWTLYNYYVALFIQDDFRLTPKLTLNLGLRWDPKFDFTEPSRKRMTFEPPRQSRVFPNAPRGLLFQGDEGYEKYIIPRDWNNIAPRVGLAYQVFPRTVVRAAYGIFFDQYMGHNNNRTAQGEPFVRQALLTARPSLANIYGNEEPLDPSPVVPGPDFVFRPYGTWALPHKDMRAGYMQNWNLVIERQIADWLFRASYVGSKGTDLLYSAEVNPGIYRPGATLADVNQRRIYQPIGPLQLGMAAGWSKYHSAQFTVQKQYRNGLTLLANYTISKSQDNSSYCAVAGNCAGPNPFNFNDNAGLSDFDMPQRLVVSGIWEMPSFENRHRLWKAIFGSWQSNFIFTTQSGTPITIFSGVDNALMGVGGNFADLTGIDWRLPSDRPKGEKILRWFNPAAFRVNEVGTIGTGRRNQLRAPGAWNIDYSVFKNFRVRESVRLQCRGEFFNLLNHARLGVPVTTVTSALFGRITSAFDPRIVQLGLKLIF